MFNDNALIHIHPNYKTVILLACLTNSKNEKTD